MRGSIGNWKVAAMMMRSAVMIVTIIRYGMMIVAFMIVLLMGLVATFKICMNISVHRSGRHSCENAESEKLFQEKCHVFR